MNEEYPLKRSVKRDIRILLVFIGFVSLVPVLVGISASERSMASISIDVLLGLLIFAAMWTSLYLLQPFNDILLSDETLTQRKWFLKRQIRWDEIYSIKETTVRNILCTGFLGKRFMIICCNARPLFNNPYLSANKVLATDNIDGYDRLKGIILERVGAHEMHHRQTETTEHWSKL